MRKTDGSWQAQPLNDELSVKDHKRRKCGVVRLPVAGALAFYLSALVAMNLCAQGVTTLADRGSSASATAGSKRTFAPASVRALPRLQCKLHSAGSAPSAGVAVFTDDDGYARFHAVRPGAGDAIQQFSLDCTDTAGRPSSWTVDLASDDTFAPRPVNLARERGTDRPALQGDSLSYSQAGLIRAAYGLRPDREKNPAAYARWLASASAPGRLLEAKRPQTESHGVTTMESPWWVGSVLAGKPKYVSTEAAFNVPTGIPGSDETTITEIAIWNGLGGFNSGSGLIQGGVNVSTTPTVAAYGSWREYCCGDPNSSGNGGQFVPNPGDPRRHGIAMPTASSTLMEAMGVPTFMTSLQARS
jgi:hypothetical protein